MHKEETVYPRDGRRRNTLRRWITDRSDEAIKTGSRKDTCSICQYTGSRKKMHAHFRQHYTKHFCSCGYRSASYDSIYCHQKDGPCSTRDIHEVDRNSYPRFLRHIGWRTAPIFGECIPTLDREGRRTMTYRRPDKNATRRPVKERLGRPTRTPYVQDTHPELERLEREARWHEKEAARYREKARRWRRDNRHY